MTTATEPVRLAKTQIREAGGVLSRAFHDDPAVEYIFRGGSNTARAMDWFFTVMARCGRMCGDEVYTTAGRLDGVAIWHSPGEYPPGLLGMVRAGMILAAVKLGPAALARFMRIMDPLERLHKRDAPPQHWYLQFLGVDPPRQGRGIGSTLMQPVVARADAEALPCYLETTNGRTVPLYQRHGFEVVVEGDLPKGGPRFWTMEREPRG
jgi:ribosomal protein S18 acetylase RimI-like enzyme